MARERFGAEEKVKVLRRHLVEITLPRDSLVGLIVRMNRRGNLPAPTPKSHLSETPYALKTPAEGRKQGRECGHRTHLKNGGTPIPIESEQNGERIGMLLGLHV